MRTERMHVSSKHEMPALRIDRHTTRFKQLLLYLRMNLNRIARKTSGNQITIPMAMKTAANKNSTCGSAMIGTTIRKMAARTPIIGIIIGFCKNTSHHSVNRTQILWMTSNIFINTHFDRSVYPYQYRPTLSSLINSSLVADNHNFAFR